MEWEEIKENYPKAYKKAWKWGEIEGYDYPEDGIFTFMYGQRLLYDFF